MSKEEFSRTIAVDFDGTVVTHEYPKVGRDVGAVPVLKDLVEAGHRLILYTMRSGQELEDAVCWFTDHKITLWAVNDNPWQKEWTTSQKIWANVYIDDAALGTPLCPGLFGERPFVDWSAVRKMLEEQGLLEKQADIKYDTLLAVWQPFDPATMQNGMYLQTNGGENGDRRLGMSMWLNGGWAGTPKNMGFEEVAYVLLLPSHPKDCRCVVVDGDIE